MDFPAVAPLMAAGGSELISLIVFILMGIGWVIQQVSGKNQPAEPPVRRPPKAAPPPPRPRNDRLQDEIDIFIQEVNQQREGNPPRTAPPRPPAPVANPRAAAEKEAAARRRNRVESLPPPTAAPPTPPPRRSVGQEVAARKSPASDDFGKGVRGHVAQHLPAGTVTKTAEQFVGDRVDQSVASHLGAFTAPGSQAVRSAASDRNARLKQLLRNHATIRQAIVMNEILGKPKGLRK